MLLDERGGITFRFISNESFPILITVHNIHDPDAGFEEVFCMRADDSFAVKDWSFIQNLLKYGDGELKDAWYDSKAARGILRLVFVARDNFKEIQWSEVEGELIWKDVEKVLKN